MLALGVKVELDGCERNAGCGGCRGCGCRGKHPREGPLVRRACMPCKQAKLGRTQQACTSMVVSTSSDERMNESKARKMHADSHATTPRPATQTCSCYAELRVVEYKHYDQHAKPDMHLGGGP